MGRDRSLDEFMNQSDTTQTGDEDNATPDRETGKARETETEGDKEPSTLSVHPARSTMAWTGDEETCDACGDVVKRRWRDGEQLVCGECKEW